MSHRPTAPPTHAVSTSILSAVLYGLGGGLIGAVAMTATENIEQNVITARPPSLVPGYTLLRLFSKSAPPRSNMQEVNLLAQFSFGAVVGGARGIMAWYGIKGPFADFLFLGIRVAFDQTLENWTGIGTAPWTWPTSEQILDLVHKAVFAFVTGYAVDQQVV
ncbi:hypothetical protein AMATHDRAFT_70822 [Amanita thiersii Skay4041]|uniref:Uncharacterized protein n=1 Tax=Amanita thiersii Skay4041 TaxID=703135 RepID=A0A2A9NCI7_9AGAR|nr:hypothetical protein AMATHDRAFT_70822 [Amanita thiersii Skay4041]